MQGDDPRYLKVSAAPKHFTAYDGPESSQPGAPSGRMGFDAEVPEEDLDQTWLDHWKAVVENSGVHKLGGVMCSYSALDGVPMCGNRRMLTDKLRTEWGHSGWVVSDCGAIGNIQTQHHYVNSTAEAAALALTAGCDIECDSAFGLLPEAIAGGLALQADVDTALYRSLIQQFQLGVFDKPELNPYSKLGMELVDSAAHRQLAREAAQQSAVLLSNV
jgi:beta-glucosidase